MPNGLSHTQRSHAANARRKRAHERARERAPVRCPEATQNALHCLVLEIERTEPGIDAETCFLRAFRRFICEGHTRNVADVAHLRESIHDTAGGPTGEFIHTMVDSLARDDHWDCPVAIIEAAVQNLRAAGLPEPIVDALHRAQMPLAKPAAAPAAAFAEPSD